MNFFDRYFDYVAGGECPDIYHRWSVITGLGALLGRQFYVPHGHTVYYPNTYCMLIGTPGTRKSTGIKVMRSLLQAAGYDKFSANRVTKEKFLMELSGAAELDLTDKVQDLTFESIFNENVSDPREVLIAADEMGDFMGAGNVEFISLLTTLWDNLPTYEYKVKNSQSVDIYKPTISILSGNTPEGFAMTFPVAILGQGFMSRLLLIYGEPSGVRVAWPEEPDVALAKHLAEMLIHIKQSVSGKATITQEAKQALTRIYDSWVDLDDLRFKHYSTRRFAHLLKLLLVVVAAEGRTVVDIQDVVFGNSMLAYAETLMPKALGEFGQSKHSDVSQKMMEALYNATAPLTQKDLWKLVMHDLEKPTELAVLLHNLLIADRIFVADMPGDKSGYLPKKKKLQASTEFVDFKLLREYK